MKIQFPWFTLYGKPSDHRVRCFFAMLTHEFLHIFTNPHEFGSLGYTQTLRYSIGIPDTSPLLGTRGSSLMMLEGEDEPGVVDGGFLYIFNEGFRSGSHIAGRLIGVKRGNAAFGWEDWPTSGTSQTVLIGQDEDVTVPAEPGVTIVLMKALSAERNVFLPPASSFPMTVIIKDVDNNADNYPIEFIVDGSDTINGNTNIGIVSTVGTGHMVALSNDGGDQWIETGEVSQYLTLESVDSGGILHHHINDEATVVEAASGITLVTVDLLTGTRTLGLPPASGSTQIIVIKEAGAGDIDDSISLTIVPDGTDTADTLSLIGNSLNGLSCILVNDGVSRWLDISMTSVLELFLASSLATMLSQITNSENLIEELQAHDLVTPHNVRWINGENEIDAEAGDILVIDATGTGGVIVYLPTQLVDTPMGIIIRKYDGGGDQIIAVPEGTDTINGDVNQNLATKGTMHLVTAGGSGGGTDWTWLYRWFD